MVGGLHGVTPSWPMGANGGLRALVVQHGRRQRGMTDRHTHSRPLYDDNSKTFCHLSMLCVFVIRRRITVNLRRIQTCSKLIGIFHSSSWFLVNYRNRTAAKCSVFVHSIGPTYEIFNSQFLIPWNAIRLDGWIPP